MYTINFSIGVTMVFVCSMPGHVKKSDGPDPDPSQWLYVSYELKEKNKVSMFVLTYQINHLNNFFSCE